MDRQERTFEENRSLTEAEFTEEELEVVSGGMSTYFQCGGTVIVIAADQHSYQVYTVKS
jgi:hypothetical protein